MKKEVDFKNRDRFIQLGLTIAYFRKLNGMSQEELAEIEKEMKKIIKENISIERFTLPREEAIALMKERGEIYKVEHIGDLDENAVISFYQQGEYVDLCRGPHLPSTGCVKAVRRSMEKLFRST